jgi:KUP system potassium uptake protein
LAATSFPLEDFLAEIARKEPLRVKGTAIYMAGNPKGTPLAILHNLKHNRVLHERVVILTILAAQIPHVSPANRVEIVPLVAGFYRVIARFGFMEDPTMPEVLLRCREQGFELDPMQTTFFLSRETILPTTARGWRGRRDRLFAILSRNAQPATAFFHLPANRVVELGMQVEL